MNSSKTTKEIKEWIAPNERSQRALFQHIFSLFFLYFFRGLEFLGRTNTRVCKKILPRYQTVQKCAVPTKTIFHCLEQVKVDFLGVKGFPQAPWVVSTTVNQIIYFFSSLISPNSACQEHSKSAKKVAQIGNGKTKKGFSFYNILILDPLYIRMLLYTWYIIVYHYNMLLRMVCDTG